MAIDDEARAVDPGIETDLVPHANRTEAGEEGPDVGLVHLADLVGTDRAGDGFGRGRHVVLFGGELHALLEAAGGGKAVDRLRRGELPDVDGEAFGRELG